MITTPIQLRFNDIDIQGHMYNGQYQHIFDLGKNEYFERILGIERMDGPQTVVTASSTTNFYVPVGMKDRIAIRTGIERVGTKSFTVFQEMIDLDTDTVKADSRTVLVGWNAVTKESFAIPDVWREKIAREERFPR
ncbi:thioesterase family protein [uncultured Rikenella sp.]|uniref:acyl-CoA thioesterase n=1 Tax=uncultured Rikenella sp. TaxID=368003 RepID=UPI0025DBEB11|nr:thioesterase family protein [uncultured Rikenella sp.]